MGPEPLPENPFLPSASHTAYNQCQILEAEANASRIPHVEGCPPPVVCARLLGHLFRLAPAGNPRRQLQREIVSAQSDNVKLMQLATVYLQGFIRTFKRSSGPTPAPSEHPSCPSFEDACEYALSMIEECKMGHRTARTWAMRRDNSRCMITGLVDSKQPDGQIVVQTAHIIPQSVDKNIGEGEHEAKCFHSAGVWSILSMFSRENIVEDLAGNRINRLENIVSMNASSHLLFDDLMLWLKPVENSPHTYRVCTAKDSLRHVPPLPEHVTFSTATDLPLPHHEYLALHALCCEVAWMSGAAEYIVEVERRIGVTKVLATDGSTVDLLMAALSGVGAH